jgi:tetratricopeptide (TPR) repeat protein
MKSLYKKIALLAIVLGAFVLLPVNTSAQSIKEKKADRYFESYAYSKAVEIYEDLYANDTKNAKYIQRLAYSYDKMLNYRKALIFYSLLVQIEQHQPSDLYEYAQLLRIDGRPELAKVWLEKYMVQSPGDQRAKGLLDNISNNNGGKSGIENVSIKNLDGNTRFTDMCPNYFKNQLVYSSARDSFSMVRNTYDWNNQPFLDLYITNPGSGPGAKDSKSVFSLIQGFMKVLLALLQTTIQCILPETIF